MECLQTKGYEQRLQSFVGWPANSCQLPEGLAAAGFTYEGRGDRVRCESCKVRLYDWIPGDPLKRHGKFSKYRCELYKELTSPRELGTERFRNSGHNQVEMAAPNNETVFNFSEKMPISIGFSTECQDVELPPETSVISGHGAAAAFSERLPGSAKLCEQQDATLRWPVGLDEALMDWPDIKLLLRHGVDERKLRSTIRTRLNEGRDVIGDIPGLTKELLK